MTGIPSGALSGEKKSKLTRLLRITFTYTCKVKSNKSFRFIFTLEVKEENVFEMKAVMSQILYFTLG